MHRAVYLGAARPPATGGGSSPAPGPPPVGGLPAVNLLPSARAAAGRPAARRRAASGRARRYGHRSGPHEPWAVAAARAVAAGVLTTICGLVLWSLLPCVLGWTPQVVLTGSMSPGIRPGDLILAAPVHGATLRPGQVMLFDDPARPGRRLVHRLVRIDAAGDLITKGDANAVEDSTPVAPSSVIGLPRLRVPLVGLPVVWAHEHRPVPLVAVAVLLVASGALLGQEPDNEPATTRMAQSHRRPSL